ncbi:MAG TPA: nucleotide exchange factor GrpE [Galbitalea sp.]|jgi:molecular chaperone GrpE
MVDKKKPEQPAGAGKDPKDKSDAASAAASGSEDGDAADVSSVDDLVEAEGPDVETLTDEEISFLEAGERELLADMRNDLARAQAELVNFRKRVERDRQANREAVIAEVIRTLLPAVDDLYRAEEHGDLAGSPLEIVAQKLHAAFARYGLRKVGEKGEVFDPNLHEALVQLPSPDVEVNTVADVIEPGYALGDRLLRAAKVAVSVPDGS